MPPFLTLILGYGVAAFGKWLSANSAPVWRRSAIPGADSRLGLALVEQGWGLKQAPGLTVLGLTLGPLMVGPLILIAGVLGGVSLYGIGRRMPLNCDARPPAQVSGRLGNQTRK